jgi:hypothetical protein
MQGGALRHAWAEAHRRADRMGATWVLLKLRAAAAVGQGAESLAWPGVKPGSWSSREFHLELKSLHPLTPLSSWNLDCMQAIALLALPPPTPHPPPYAPPPPNPTLPPPPCRRSRHEARCRTPPASR